MDKLAVDYINSQVMNSPGNFIIECEEKFKKTLEDITQIICKKNGRCLVMLAGPSSSGKTTTANILKKNIVSRGRHASVISLDDFYLDQGSNYTFEDGTVDYETVKALDVPLIGKCLTEIIEKGETSLPHFSFLTKRRESFTDFTVCEDEIIIIEGLHALNPAITECAEGQNMLKLYISVSSRIYGNDAEVLLSKRDIRFVRRLIRDFHFRDSSAENTFYLWKGVRMGEDRYLFPFSSRADIKIDSIHPYESCVFRDIAIELLENINESSEYYEDARIIEGKLRKFIGLTENDVPSDSLLREFIG